MSLNRWELYNDDLTAFAAAEADLNAALAAVEAAAKQAALLIAKARKDAMAALEKHAAVGACDSEPQAHMHARMRRVCRDHLASFV